MQKLSSFTLKLLAAVFYALALFIIAAEIFSVEIYSYFDRFNSSYTMRPGIPDIHISQIDKNPELIEKYGFRDTTYFTFDDNNYIIMCSEDKYPVNSSPEYFILTYFDNYTKPVLEKKTAHGWEIIKDSIIDTVYFSDRGAIRFINEGKSYLVPKHAIVYKFKHLPIGFYRISSSLYDVPVDYYFHIIKGIASQWQINKSEFCDSAYVHTLLFFNSDTRSIYEAKNESSDPYFLCTAQIYKDNKWSRPISLYDNSCKYDTHLYATRNKYKIHISNYNPLYDFLIYGYDNYISQYLSSDSLFNTHDIESYKSHPSNINFIYSDNFSNYVSEEVGDSIRIQLSFEITPMPWSNYEQQTLYSDYYTFSTEEVIAGFRNNLERIRRRD